LASRRWTCLIQTDGDGRGVINVLAADKLLQSPRLYATFLLWLLSELFEQLPEVGDLDKPRLLFFFDEAHLLFNAAPRALLERVEQVVRIIRSKGVGVFFVTQSPADIPDVILGQMGNRVQHALRAFTPRDQRAVRAAAATLRPNPSINTKQAITELGVGEALVSFLDEKGMPGVVERALIVPPCSQIGPITPEQRRQIITRSLVYNYYERRLDRESAYEMLAARAQQLAADDEPAAREAEAQREARRLARQQAQAEAPQARRLEREERERRRRAEREARRREKVIGGVLEAFVRGAARSVGRSARRSLLRGILGGLTGSSSSRR